MENNGCHAIFRDLSMPGKLGLDYKPPFVPLLPIMYVVYGLPNTSLRYLKNERLILPRGFAFDHGGLEGDAPV